MRDLRPGVARVGIGDDGVAAVGIQQLHPLVAQHLGIQRAAGFHDLVYVILELGIPHLGEEGAAEHGQHVLQVEQPLLVVRGVVHLVGVIQQLVGGGGHLLGKDGGAAILPRLVRRGQRVVHRVAALMGDGAHVVGVAVVVEQQPGQVFIAGLRFKGAALLGVGGIHVHVAALDDGHEGIDVVLAQHAQRVGDLGHGVFVFDLARVEIGNVGAHVVGMLLLQAQAAGVDPQIALVIRRALVGGLDQHVVHGGIHVVGVQRGFARGFVVVQQRAGIGLPGVLLQQLGQRVDVGLRTGQDQLVRLGLEFIVVIPGIDDVLVQLVRQLRLGAVGHGDDGIRHLHVFQVAEHLVAISQAHGYGGQRLLRLLAQGLHVGVGEGAHAVFIALEQRVGEDLLALLQRQGVDLRRGEGGQLGLLHVHGVHPGVQLGEHRVGGIQGAAQLRIHPQLHLGLGQLGVIGELQVIVDRLRVVQLAPELLVPVQHRHRLVVIRLPFLHAAVDGIQIPFHGQRLLRFGNLRQRGNGQGQQHRARQQRGQPSLHRLPLLFLSVYDHPGAHLSAICRATNTPLALAWLREWVTPLPSPITYRPLWQVSRCSSRSTSML